MNDKAWVSLVAVLSAAAIAVFALLISMRGEERFPRSDRPTAVKAPASHGMAPADPAGVMQSTAMGAAPAATEK